MASSVCHARHCLETNPLDRPSLEKVNPRWGGHVTSVKILGQGVRIEKAWRQAFLTEPPAQGAALDRL
jgi:hypothetical protein